MSIAVGAFAAVASIVALGSKWQLGTRGTALFAASVAALVGAIAVAVTATTNTNPVLAGAAVWTASIVIGGAVVLFRFHRDPERIPPDAPDAVVSPADGTVVYLRAVHGGTLPESLKNGRRHRLDELTKTPLHLAEANVVGIALNLLDVHVNRAPISASVELRRHAGRFGSLRQPQMLFENERVTMIFRRDEIQVAVVLIASRLVRRIVTYIQNGNDVVIGQRIGMIRFGSQVDLILPPAARLEKSLAVGNRVVAGETVVARLEPPRPALGMRSGAETATSDS